MSAQDLDTADAALDLLRRTPRPAGEPPFDMRAQDIFAADAARHWVRLLLEAGGDEALAELALQRIDEIDAWPVKKMPDASHLSLGERAILKARFATRVWSAEPHAPRALQDIAEARIRSEGFSAGKRSLRRTLKRFQEQITRLQNDLVTADRGLEKLLQESDGQLAALVEIWSVRPTNWNELQEDDPEQAAAWIRVREALRKRGRLVETCAACGEPFAPNDVTVIDDGGRRHAWCAPTADPDPVAAAGDDQAEAQP